MTTDYVSRPIYFVKHGSALLCMTNDIRKAFAVYRSFYNEFTAPFLTIVKEG